MIWPLGGRERTALETLQGAEWTCRSCSERHCGMFDMASAAPDPWPHATSYEPNAAIRLDGDFLSEDFCVLDGEFFMVRCVLELPVHGLEDRFAYGCWGSLKRENFEVYLDHFDAGTLPEGGPWFSWLCNAPRPFVGAESVGCLVFPQIGRQRPVLRVDDHDHPLAIAQQEGITPEDVLAIYKAYGHEIA